MDRGAWRAAVQWVTKSQTPLSMNVGKNKDFPGGPLVKTSPSKAGGLGWIPGQGAGIPHASWPKNQKVKQKQYRNKINKDLKKIK